MQHVEGEVGERWEQTGLIEYEVKFSYSGELEVDGEDSGTISFIDTGNSVVDQMIHGLFEECVTVSYLGSKGGQCLQAKTD